VNSQPEGGVEPQLRHYQDVVAQYEALDREIDALLMQYGGASENMPAWELARYRKLARQRDDLQNEMRALEQVLFDDAEFGAQE
jgi:hypothetical protein